MRLFIGIPLPSEYAHIIRKIQEAWKKRLISKVSWVRPELAHVTLKFLGEVDEEKIPAILQAMREAARGSFEAQGGAGGFFPPKGAPRVVWVGLRQGREECAAYFEKLDGGIGEGRVCGRVETLRRAPDRCAGQGRDAKRRLVRSACGFEEGLARVHGEPCRALAEHPQVLRAGVSKSGGSGTGEMSARRRLGDIFPACALPLNAGYCGSLLISMMALA